MEDALLRGHGRQLARCRSHHAEAADGSGTATGDGRFVPSALASSTCASFGERSGGGGIPSTAAARGVNNEVFSKKDAGKKEERR